MRSHLSLLATAAALALALVVASVAQAADPPVASTTAAKDVGQTQATLTATVTPNGAATSVRFDLGTSTSYGLQSASKDVGSGSDPVTVEIPVEGLTARTTYHFRVVATSEGGTAQGADATLRTAAVPVGPTRLDVTTGVARDVGVVAATLTGAVNPRGADATYHFDYGTTTSYGSSTPEASAGGGTGSVAVSARITGLTAGKLYHYRLVAISAVGTRYGAGRAFTAATTATAATLAADRARVTYGSGVTLSGRLSGSRVRGVRVRLQTTPFPFSAPFADTGNAVLSASTGGYRFRLPSVTTTLRALVVVEGLPSFFSTPIVVRSAARAGITSVTRAAGRRVVVRGRVLPATANGIAALQRQSTKGTWVPLRRAHVGADGRYAVTLRARNRPMTVRTVGLTHDGGAHVQGTSRTVKIAAR
jgi:hypothetical protein